MNLQPNEVIESAPSNIALIKYMGKINSKINLATNPSLSLTLEHLRTYVRLTENQEAKDTWKPLKGNNYHPLVLSEKAQQRFLNFWFLLKQEFNIEGYFLVESANTFASDCGMASSASSFAALTKAAYQMSQNFSHSKTYTHQELANLSQKGSGSSCRSFFSPWCLWSDNSIHQLNVHQNFENLVHFVAIVDDSIKEVSSSLAHQRVLSSLNFNGRAERVNQRMEKVILALEEGEWDVLFQHSWNEFWDMHSLFETSQPAFGYMTAGSLFVLKLVKDIWKKYDTGPIVTMDAGANVHLIFRQDHNELWSHLHSLLEKTNIKLIGNLV